MTKRTPVKTAASASKSRELTAMVNDIPVHYVEHGSGMAALVLHGWLDRVEEHRAAAEAGPDAATSPRSSATREEACPPTDPATRG